VSLPVRDPIGGAASGATPEVQHREPRALMARNLSSCTRVLAGVVGQAGAKGQARASRCSGA
jgi:hypothetical protein